MRSACCGEKVRVRFLLGLNKGDEMKPEVARRRIEAFERRFEKTHLIFACHAAFPLALTPDLLYKLWANFQRDIHGFVLGIPWVAVADLLLSSLCDEVGRELYEMDTAVRNSLLNRLKENENFGHQRINELSDFLLVYVRQQLQSNDQEVRDFAQAQRWTALAYTRPSEAARELALALKNAYQQDRSEVVRMASLVETFAEPLAEFEPLLVYARSIDKFTRGDLAGTVAQPNQVSAPQKKVAPAGVKLNITPSLAIKTVSKRPLIANRYQVIRQVSKGGFSRIYEVDDRGTIKILKILKLDAVDEEHKGKLVESFKQEADILCRLRHPGIPRAERDGYFTLITKGKLERVHCFVMEKINGVNLEQWLIKRNRPINEYLAINWLKQLAYILDQVHHLNYFHRDIKPSNIMVQPNGKLVLIDFGAVREVSATYFAKVGQGGSVTVIISPGYTPLEQANGKAIPQSDFFALGRTFVHLLTGKSPTAFPENPRTGRLMWRKVAPHISDPFANVIDYLMAPFPGNRPQSPQVILQCIHEMIVEQQFSKLTNLEKDIMYKLASDAAPVSVETLRIFFPKVASKLIDNLQSLVARSLIKKVKVGSEILFTLEPEIREDVVRKLNLPKK